MVYIFNTGKANIVREGDIPQEFLREDEFSNQFPLGRAILGEGGFPGTLELTVIAILRRN